MPRIVVGVDGSEHSKRALRRAVEEAALRDATLDAVHVFRPPRRAFADDLISLPIGIGVGMGPISPDDANDPRPNPDEQAAGTAYAALERFVADATEGMSGPKPGLVVIASDDPADALLDASRDADLVVIGTRGLGGFAGMLLGSVAHQCIQRCRCPMLILPPEE